MWGAVPEVCLMFFVVVIRMLNQKFPDKQFNSLTTAQQRLKHPAEICHDNLLTGSIAKEMWNLSRRDNNQHSSSGSSSDAFLSRKNQVRNTKVSISITNLWPRINTARNTHRRAWLQQKPTPKWDFTWVYTEYLHEYEFLWRVFMCLLSFS